MSCLNGLINIDYSGSKRKNEKKLIKATTTTIITMMTITGAKGTTLVYTRVFRLYGSYILSR